LRGGHIKLLLRRWACTCKDLQWVLKLFTKTIKHKNGTLGFIETKDDGQNAGKTIPKENNMFPPQPMMFDETLANYMMFPSTCLPGGLPIL
jgi:hypothetical protein